jgi:uncharacterized protein YaiL (DUF2058 family)
MGDLRDQLKKAKLLSEKEAKQLAHQDRVRRAEVGREALEREEAQRRAELAQQQEAEREAQREQQRRLEEERRAAAERAACRELLEREVIRPRERGGKRWYFQLPDGSLPWLEVDEALAFQLQSGAYWVVRLGPPGTHVYGLLAAEHARRVAATLSEAIAWFPGQR